jgi:glycosyltransferase involved in cell wall biosynthesis
LKLLAKLEAKRVKRYEGQIVNQFDHTLAVTHEDQLALTEAAQTYSREHGDNSPEIWVVPIAVDTHSMTPLDRDPGSQTILTLGTLHYPPNADGIRWFLKEVFPLVKAQIPHSKLIIVGKNPPQDFLRAQEDQPESVTVTGYVPDLEPYLQASAIVTVPVRAGGGMRVRILEAFARGMPVVTTTIGLEGIEAEIGREVLVADTAEDFSAEVVHLLRDSSLQVCLAQNARQLAEEKYDWQIVLKKMDAIYSRDN